MNLLTTCYQLSINFLSTFYQLCISCMSTFHQHMTNVLLLYLKISKSFLFIDSLLFCVNFAVGLFGDCWSRHDYWMFLWPRCCGQCNVCNSLQLAVVRPPSQLLGRSCCYWELVPLCQSHFLQFNRIVPWFVVSLIICCLETVQFV